MTYVLFEQTTPFTREEKCSVKILTQAKRNCLEYRRSDLLRKIDKTGSVEREAVSGRPARSVRTQRNTSRVSELIAVKKTILILSKVIAKSRKLPAYRTAR